MSKVLIHIGYPKTGATCLQSWFARHPDFFYNGKTLAGFGNAWDIARYSQLPENSHRWFVMSSVSLSVWRGDFDIVGLKFRKYDIRGYQKKLPETLYGIFPGAKILIVTRGFASMLISLWAEYIVSGGVLPFEDFFQQHKNNLTEIYHYDRVIQSFSESFGNDNIIVLPFELLKENPVRFISLIEKGLGTGQGGEPIQDKINPSPGRPYLEANLMVSKLLYRIVQPLPYSLQKRIYGRFVGLLGKRKNIPLIKFLSVFLGKKPEIRIGEEKLKLFAGNAAILRNEELFQPYLKEYLL